jgi:sugar O-acyltransferase (sialic acid O-acetyltransferase NeuD family)
VSAPRGSLYLVGTGSFAVEVAEWASDAGWSVAGFVELLDSSRVGTSIGGLQVVDPAHPPGGARAAIALGGDRFEHRSRLGEGWDAATIVHSHAHVSRSAELAGGCVVGPGAVIGAEVAVGEHALISRGALVGHHARIGTFVSLLPGANVGGHAEIEDRATVGMSAAIANNVRVGPRSTIAAGAVVVSPVAAGVRVQGVPAREYRHAAPAPR